MKPRITILVKKAALEAEKTQNPILQRYDLTVAQYKILKYLYASSEQSVRLVDIERYFSMTHPATIDVLKLLEKKGYTVRTPNPQDARSKIVSLTEKALQEKDRLYDLGDEMEAAVTQNLDEAEKAEMIRLLQKMLGIEWKDGAPK